jgi:hypothetical protein
LLARPVATAHAQDEHERNDAANQPHRQIDTSVQKGVTAQSRDVVVPHPGTGAAQLAWFDTVRLDRVSTPTDTAAEQAHDLRHPRPRNPLSAPNLCPST